MAPGYFHPGFLLSLTQFAMQIDIAVKPDLRITIHVFFLSNDLIHFEAFPFSEEGDQ